METLNKRGMFIEKILATTHQSYRLRHRASVYKVPVLQMARPESPYKRAHYFCDYVGCYKGHYFEFEAKETMRAEFHWSQVRKSQRYKLQQIHVNQGLSFIIIYFANYNQFWLFFYEDLQNFVNTYTQKISYAQCQCLGTQVPLIGNTMLDYLPILAKKIASKRDNLFVVN